MANTPRIGFSSQNVAKLSLGTVPIETDGSVYFEAPIGRPILPPWFAGDANGNLEPVYGGSRSKPGMIGARGSRMGKVLLNTTHQQALTDGKFTEVDMRTITQWLDLGLRQERPPKLEIPRWDHPHSPPQKKWTRTHPIFPPWMLRKWTCPNWMRTG